MIPGPELGELTILLQRPAMHGDGEMGFTAYGTGCIRVLLLRYFQEIQRDFD